ncbi:MAG: ATP-binding protein [candidate division KSB1 bacterium]|jgi:PAS domain S-box-containing protein|nr:ATP-binding protein [candidate division KSB1 bacterium]
MNVKFLQKETLFKRVLAVILIIALIPLVLSGLNLLRFDADNIIRSSALIFYGLIVLTVILSVAGAGYISKKISKPLTQLTKSATEIARGNFSHRIKVSTEDEVGRLAKIFNYMTTELQRLNEMNLNDIITEKNKTKTIIKNIADGVIVTDPAKKILMINSVAEQWFELNEKDVINVPVDQVIGKKELINEINHARNSENSIDKSVEVQLRPKNFRKKVVLQAKAAEVIDNEGTPIGIVTILRDVTREKEIDKMKTELVSMVAHELRSPLTSIAGFSELLLDSGITKDQSEEYAEIILKESNRLGNLINKFLDISRIESGKSQVNKIALDIGFLITNIIGLNLQQAEKKKIRVEMNIPEDLPSVNADKGMIEEVILNLFSNAVKYSPEHTMVTISANQSETDLIVSVKDEGYGISKEALQNIFNKFYRVTDNEHVREIEGSGLGLSLVKEIIELHGGNVWAESELAKGSQFFFTLPIAADIDDSTYLQEIENEYVT